MKNFKLSNYVLLGVLSGCTAEEPQSFQDCVLRDMPRAHPDMAVGIIYRFCASKFGWSDVRRAMGDEFGGNSDPTRAKQAAEEAAARAERAAEEAAMQAVDAGVRALEAVGRGAPEESQTTAE